MAGRQTGAYHRSIIWVCYPAIRFYLTFLAILFVSFNSLAYSVSVEELSSLSNGDKFTPGASITEHNGSSEPGWNPTNSKTSGTIKAGLESTSKILEPTKAGSSPQEASSTSNHVIRDKSIHSQSSAKSEESASQNVSPTFSVHDQSDQTTSTPKATFSHASVQTTTSHSYLPSGTVSEDDRSVLSLTSSFPHNVVNHTSTALSPSESLTQSLITTLFSSSLSSYKSNASSLASDSSISISSSMALSSSVSTLASEYSNQSWSTKASMWSASVQPTEWTLSHVSSKSSAHVTSSSSWHSSTYSHSTTTATSALLSTILRTSSSHHKSSIPGVPLVTVSHGSQSTPTFQPPTDKPSHLICDELLLELSDAMNNMTGCLMHYMKPLQVCEKCNGKYRMLQMYHKYVFAQEVCGKMLVGNYNEQFQLIPKFYQFHKNTWESFDCIKCSDTDEDDPYVWKPTKQFVQFKKYLTETMNCIYNYSSVLPVYPIVTGNQTVIGNSTKIACKECKPLYVNLQHYFATMFGKSEHGSQWCADIIYAVNETRKMWGQVLRCDVVEKDLESVVALTCFFCFMPIVFYVGTKLHSDVKERKHGSRLGYESD